MARSRNGKIPGLTKARLYRWIELLESITERYNDQVVKGTDVKRKHVNKANSREVLAKMLDTEFIDDFQALNTITMSNTLSPGIRRRVFRFGVGEKVLLARKADPQLKNTTFSKPSLQGDYGQAVFVVVKQVLRTNREHVLIPMYKLKRSEDGRNKYGLFYESQLVRAGFANTNKDTGNRPQGDDQEEEEEEDPAS